MTANNIDIELETDSLDTSQFWKSRDESTQLSMNEKLLSIARNGPSEEFVSILERECVSSSDGLYSIDLDIVDKSGWSPLIHASFNGHLIIVQNIISYQEKKYGKEYGDELINNELKWKFLFKQFLCRKVKWNGSTALHLACARGHELIVKLLINKMIHEYNLSLSESINAIDYDAATPLHCAVLGKHYNVCKLLLINGSIINKSDIRGKTPLDWAKERGLNQFSNLLIQYQQHQQMQNSNIVENIWEEQENKSMEQSVDSSIHNECENNINNNNNNNNNSNNNGPFNVVINSQNVIVGSMNSNNNNNNIAQNYVYHQHQHQQYPPSSTSPSPDGQPINGNNIINNINNNNVAIQTQQTCFPFNNNNHNNINNPIKNNYGWYRNHNNYHNHNNNNQPHYQYRQMAPRHLRYNNYCNNNNNNIRYQSQTPSSTSSSSLPSIPTNPPRLTVSKSWDTHCILNEKRCYKHSSSEILEIITIPSKTKEKIDNDKNDENENKNRNKNPSNSDENKLEEISDKMDKISSTKIREKIIAAQTPTQKTEKEKDDINDINIDGLNVDDVDDVGDNIDNDTNSDNPAMDAIRFQNKYLIARCVTLEKEHKEIANEFQQQIMKCPSGEPF